MKKRQCHLWCMSVLVMVELQAKGCDGLRNADCIPRREMEKCHIYVYSGDFSVGEVKMR